MDHSNLNMSLINPSQIKNISIYNLVSEYGGNPNFVTTSNILQMTSNLDLSSFNTALKNLPKIKKNITKLREIGTSYFYLLSKKNALILAL